MNAEDRLFLLRRPRRLRKTHAIRSLTTETLLCVNKLIQPLFVIDGNGKPEPIASMPGIYRLPIPSLIEECQKLMDLGLHAVALFPKLESSCKDKWGSEALKSNTLILRAIRAVKTALPELCVITDIALDPYTSHGHDGVFTESELDIDNDHTVARLTQMATLHAQAGADWVAPSDMMDGRVRAIREHLDANGHSATGILAYSVKYASAYYGPFREAVGSKAEISKESYQMNPANRREALIEASLDEAEGADMLMVKPAGLYLDVIREIRNHTNLPLAAYQVSGEYSQILAAARMGWLDLQKCREEALLAICRAGADIILTYFAKTVAESTF